MTTNFNDVGNFHHKFDLDNTTWNDPGPRPHQSALMTFRLEFLREELDKEFAPALEQGDIVEMADALIDLVYVAMGTAHLLGLPWQELWNEVQQSNMKKVRAARDGSDSKRGSEFDVVKPEGWKPPDIAGVLRRNGFDV